MSSITVSASPIKGTAAVPPSKSAAHRALICAALAGGGTVKGVSSSEDVRATLRSIHALGLQIQQQGDTITVKGGIQQNNESSTPVVVDCMESGSTLRFLIPLFAALGIHCVFTGSGRLPQRPLGAYADCLPKHGVTFKKISNLSLPLEIKGRLQAGWYELPGNVSSQFISGLLFALPLCKGDSEIILTTPLESAAYVEMTVEAMREAGVVVEHMANGWKVYGSQTYKPHNFIVEGDWSQAAFLLAMGVLSGEIAVTGLNLDSKQGDREILTLMKRFGADIRHVQGKILSAKSKLHGIDIDASQIPDLVPILSVLGTFAHGKTTISGASRLRLKESDRLAAIAHNLNKLGGRVEETSNGLHIEGVERLQGGVTVSGFKDHRIVMSMAVAALGCNRPVTIEDAQSVSKSWPAFFEDFINCGGETHGF